MARPNQYNSPYSEKELKILANTKLTHNQVAEKINRSYAAVKAKRLAMGIVVATKEIDYWTQEEIKFLVTHRNFSNNEIADKLNRTAQAISLKRQKLSLSPISDQWDDYELEYLIGNYLKKNNFEIAEHLGRTTTAVQSKAYELSLTKRTDFWKKNETDFLLQNFDKPLDFIALYLNKTKAQISYKKAYLNSKGKADREKILLEEDITKDSLKFHSKKTDRYIDMLSILEVDEGFAFPEIEYNNIIAAKKWIANKHFKTSKAGEGFRRLVRLY